MQNGEELRQKGHCKSKKMTYHVRGKYNFRKGERINIILDQNIGPCM
jgi:hypothetical protein